MKNLSMEFITLTTEETKEIKGGLRYITRCTTSFEAKRNQLQANGIAMKNINHQHGVYCIEW